MNELSNKTIEEIVEKKIYRTTKKDSERRRFSLSQLVPVM